MELQWIDLSFGSESVIRVYTPAGRGTRNSGYFLESERGLFLPGSGSTESLARYNANGDVLPARNSHRGKVIDLTVMGVPSAGSGQVSMLNVLNRLYMSPRVVLSTNIEGLGPYTCIPQADTLEYDRHDDYSFSYSFILKAREAL